MSQSVECSQPADIDEGKRRFQQLLSEALSLADTLGLPPEIGAKLQEVIELSEGSADSI